jgi:colanic acid/amylovoran biosynthesis glycosyltransferase
MIAPMPPRTGALRLGYLLAEYPGSTHTFFEREIRVLEEWGVLVHIISTRHPAAAKICHEWAKRRMAQTMYLWPVTASEMVNAVSVLVSAGPTRLRRCAEATLFAKGLSLKDRLVGASLVFPAAKLLAFIRANQLDHVHCHFAGNSATLVMLTHLLADTPYSISAHGDLRYFGGNQKNKWRHAAFGIAITEALKRDLVELLGESLPARFGIAPMGIDILDYTRRTPYPAYEGEGPFKIFSCGRLNPGKGHDYLIRAIAILKAKGVDARLRIAGVDDQASNATRITLEALIHQENLDEEVKLLGALTEDGVRLELEAAHAFALASWAEPLGVATMEAMALEVPAVSTNAGGVPELIESEINGILVPPGDADGLATALLRLRNDARLCERIRLAGRSRIADRFRVERSAEMLISQIESLDVPAERDTDQLRVPRVVRQRAEKVEQQP